MWVKFGTEEGTFGPLLRARFHPHRCNVSPLRGENLQNRPLSKLLNNRRFALRAMLPVKNPLRNTGVIVKNKVACFMPHGVYRRIAQRCTTSVSMRVLFPLKISRYIFS